jgi:hypothetical protein
MKSKSETQLLADLADACTWARLPFQWYSHEYPRTGLGLLTHVTVHSGQAPLVLAQRQQVLLAACETHLDRFVRPGSKSPDLPDAVCISKPRSRGKTTSSGVRHP